MEKRFFNKFNHFRPFNPQTCLSSVLPISHGALRHYRRSSQPPNWLGETFLQITDESLPALADIGAIFLVLNSNVYDSPCLGVLRQFKQQGSLMNLKMFLFLNSPPFIWAFLKHIHSFSFVLLSLLIYQAETFRVASCAGCFSSKVEIVLEFDNSPQRNHKK